MSSRFRSNRSKEGPKSSSPIFDSAACGNSNHAIDEEFSGEYYKNDWPDDSINVRGSNGKRIFRDRSIDNRNGKLCDRSGPGASCYGDERELDENRESPDSSYHRRSCREDFRYRGDAEAEDCLPRERRTPIGKKGASSFAIGSSTTRYDLAESVNDDVILESRLASSSSLMMTATNGNSSMRALTSNGSGKQVKRIEPRRDHHRTIGSLTRGERPVIEDSSIVLANSRSSDVTDRTNTRTNDSSNGVKRDRSVKRSTRNERNEEFHLPTGAVARNKEIDDYGSVDRADGMKSTRDRSYSPIERVTNGSNGDSLTRNSERRRKDNRNDERFYSPSRGFEDVEDFGSVDRRFKRNAEGRSYSPAEDNDNGMANGNSDIPTTRSERRDKRSKDEEVGSAPKGSGRGRLEEHTVFHDNDDEANDPVGHGINGSRGENGSIKKYSDVDEDNSQGRKGISARKSHTRHKASPEDFDVQIHRYERALRAPRRDSDLARKTSFKDHESDLSRKSSFEDHQRSRDFYPSKKNNHKQRDLDITRRGSSEDRDHERVSRKNSFKSRDTESTRKSSLTSRNLLDTGPAINTNNNNNNNNSNNSNNHSRKNGSHRRDRSESLRRDRDSSITRRRSSKCNNDDDNDDDDDDEDHDKSSWKNDRHSRPLTPPKLVNLEDRDDSRDRRSRISSSSKERNAQNEDDFARNYVQDHNDCRGKIHGEPGGSPVTQGRDRFSSSTRRVVSTRSLNDSRQDNFNTRSAVRIDAPGNKLLTRGLIVDEGKPRDDGENSGFSTIERNGTTVIRIRTNSQSPVGQAEHRPRRRTIHRDVVSATRYRKYEDEAEDEDEDDEIFERDNQRRDYRAGPRRLWSNRDGGVQITDLEEGQPCLHCGETCPGFSPHSWRKNCTSCKCPKEAHDVCHKEWVSVRARLGLKGEGSNNYVGFDPRDRGLTWAPPGLPPSKVEEYFSMLPEISVPRFGTPGERHRDRQLATQLPKQDLARAYCRHLDSQHSASADDFMAARNEIALDIGSVKEILERGHECGVCHEPLKYGSLVVSASKLGLLYHPSCFQCTQCRELLVDLAYCVHDDGLYCERHYAEQLKPRCAACDELIFSGEYTKAMNKDWHSGHFCCWQCDESLTGQRYVLRDEHPYCIKCYESVFANGCEECSKIIGIDSKDLSYKDKHWHEACFLCNKCRVSLVDKQFGSKVDKIYCGNCYDAQFASRCDGCGEIFRAGTKKMEYKTRQWHEKCFCCVVCKNAIGTKTFIPREQEIYCAGCYEDKFATRCIKCNKIIISGGVTYKNEPWHRDCFTCSNCNNSLAGQRFTSRDEKPYCAECFGELFAKRCTACTKPITGIGGTRFISFEDRHWHNNCFICAVCNTSLVGRGFITDGDDIICPECAKQKLSE